MKPKSWSDGAMDAFTFWSGYWALSFAPKPWLGWLDALD
jgi:hypothetical protein